MSSSIMECKGDIADAEWQFWCRLCSKDDVRNINILPEVNQTTATNSPNSLMDFITEFFKIQIEQDAELPHWLCPQCFSLLTALSKYTIQVKKVQNMYNEIQKFTDRKSLNLREFREKYNLLDDDLFIFSLSDTKLTNENIFIPDVVEITENMIKNEVLTDEVQTGTFFENVEYKSEFQDPFGDVVENQCCEVDYNNSNKVSRDLETNNEKQFEKTNSGIKEDKYFCKDCSIYFSHSLNYHRHMKQKHGKGLFTCPRCSKTFKYACYLNRHMRSHRPPNAAQKNKTSSSTEEATKESNYTCSDCSMHFQRSSNYHVHMKKTHGVVKTEPHLTCPQCGRTFKTTFKLNSHMRTHRPMAEKRIFPCPQCERKFQTKDYVARHIKFIHENIRPFICEECGEGACTEAALREHMLTHTNDTPFICEVCEKGFKNQSRLRNHMEIHSSNKHICSECGLQLNSRVTLNRHMLVHSDVMSHKCDYCGREFKRAKTLKAHLILHSGLRPYSCDFCDRTFANGANCRTHKKKSHPEELAAQEASGEKQFTKNIPKLAVLKTVTRSAENLVPVVSKQSGNFSSGEKPKPRLKAELQPQPQAQQQQNSVFH
ncbi:zinc finger protein 479-like [Ceratitis capitata]|uniref:zinc finger protein 479-like n=1 Tax=Ceratitis capitata TaxID=7213 RepID=UPI00061888D1|nr:zinc finger protein 479-like [Ceratitis capitata]